MKTTSILTFAAAASLTGLIASLVITQDAMISTALFAAFVATLIAVHDYSPRKYFSVTAPRASAAVRQPAAARFPLPRVSPRRKAVCPRVSVSA